MAVQYERITANPVTVQLLGTKLHEKLTAAGWTLEYADADAQIGGVGGAPGWGKAPAANTSAGKAVYRMPASGSFNRWYVQVEFLWGSATTAIGMKVTTAKGVNASTGALTEAGTTCGYTAGSQNNNSGDNYVVANENGFLLGLNSTAGFFLGVERRRSLTAQYLDDAVIYASPGTGLTVVGFSTAANVAVNLSRSWSAGEYGSQPLGALVGLQGSNNVALPTTYNAQGNATGYPAGYFSTSGGLAGMLRLLMLWLPNDAPALGNQNVRIDGADRIYFAVSSGGIAPGSGRLAVATQ